MTTNIAVKFSADDQATEVARKLLDVMKGLDREQRAAAAATNALAAPAKAAADGFERLTRSVAGIRNTGGLDAIAKRIALLTEGLKSASTESASMAKLTAAEAQLQKALAQGNLSLEERIRLDRTLQQVQSSIAGATPATGLQSALAGFTKLQGILGGLGIALSAISFVRFVKGAIDAADAMNDLSKRTGVSTESLTVLTAAAEKSGADTETLATGLRNLSKQVTALGQGNAQAVETFRALGLTARDLKGLSLDQIFVRVAEAQSKFADGTGKVTAAVQLFGRAGDQLIPTLHELADDGFDKTREKLEKLNAIIGTDAAKAADDFNDKLTDLKLASRGFGLAIAESVTPPIGRLADNLTSIIASIQKLRGLMPQAGRDLVDFTLQSETGFSGLGVLLGPNGDVSLGAETTGGKILELTKRLLGLRVASDAAKGALTLAPVVVTAVEPPPVNLVDPAAAKAARQAELAAAAQQARDLLAITQAGFQQLAQANDARFAQGLEGFREFYDKRVEIATLGTAAELRTLEAERTRLAASPLAEDTQAARIARTAEIRALESQIAKVKIEGATQLATLDEQRRVAAKAAATELGQLQAQLFRAQGQDLKAAQIEIAQAADRFAETLKSQGFGESVVADLRAAFSTLFTDKAAFDAQNKVAEQQFRQLALERAKIEQKVADGTLSQREGVLAVAEAERRRLPALQEAATLMAAFADRVKDPELAAAAAQLQQQINGIGKVTLQSTKLIAEFKDNLLAIGQSGVADFLGSGLNSLFSDGDARRDISRLRGDLAAARKDLQDLQSQPASAQSQQAISALRTEIRGLEGELDSAKDKLVTIGGIVRDAFGGILASMQKLAAEIIAAKIFEKIGSIFGIGVDAGAAALAKAGVQVQKGGVAVAAAAAALLAAALALQSAFAAKAAGDVAGAVAGALGSGPVGFATGGHVRGPGSGTSDSILARLSAGEFVIRAAVVDRLGVPFLNALNGLRTPRIRSLDSVGVPRFADGGVVVAAPAAQSAHARADSLHLTVEHSEDTIVRVTKSSRGIKALTEIVRANRGQFRAALG